MPLRVEWHRNIAEVPREEWNGLALALPVPILEWEWLEALERSGSIRPETGWMPLHLTLRRGTGLVAAAPLYVKLHSEGEFVWDYVWADVAEQLGVPYYPKLVGMSPATPIPGYRFLLAPGEDEEELTDRVLDAVERLCRKNGLSGVSFPYVDPAWRSRLEARGYVAWRHQSFLWENRGFATFDEYLARFDHNQRRNIRRERRRVEEAGLRLLTSTGDEIGRADLQAIYAFYEKTNLQFGPWAAKYLNEPFFTALHAYRHRLLLFTARREGREEPLAMSLLLAKGSELYGRFWGAAERVEALHFEACYYAPIEWAIRNGVERFDPGIGGPHKVRRGFRAVPNHSLHRFFDPRLHAVMAAHLPGINDAEQARIDELNRELPWAEGRE